VTELGPGAKTLCGYMSLFPILGMIVTSLGKVSRILSTIIRFELKISLGVRGSNRSMSCLTARRPTRYDQRMMDPN